MFQDQAPLLERITGRPARRYSTYDFGRERDVEALSVVVPEPDASSLLAALREHLPPGQVAFLGTSHWLRDGKHPGRVEVEIVLAPGASQFDILRRARTDGCNYGLATEDLVRRLQLWDLCHGIDVFRANTDTIELTLARLPEDLEAFAREVYEFCPDVVDQGVGSVDELVNAIRGSRRVYLWWD